MSHVQAIRRTVAAANSGNVALAKTHLQKAAEAAPEDAAVWLWLGWFAESPINAVQCLEMAVEDDRYRDLANAGLAWARAMANFRLAEDGPVFVAPAPVFAPPQTATRSVAPVAQVEVIEHRAEKLLAANVAQVAAEVAEAVAAPVVAAKTAIAEVPRSVGSAASSEVLTTIDALTLDPWTAEPVTEPVKTSTRTAESPADLSSEQPRANAIRPRETSLGHAGLWSGLGLGAKHDSEPEPEPIEPSHAAPAAVAPAPATEPNRPSDAPSQPAFTSNWFINDVTGPAEPMTTATAAESLGSSVMFSTPAASTIDAGVVRTTVSQPIVAPKGTESIAEMAPTPEELAFTEPITTDPETSAPTAAPGLWRAMKSSWFSSQPTAEIKPAAEPIEAQPTSEATGPTTRQKRDPQPASPVLVDPVLRSAPDSDSLFAWQREPIETEPQPARQAAQEIDIASADDVFDEDEPIVVVPLAHEAPRDIRVLEVAPVLTPTVKTILVVDDSPTVRKLVAMTLEKRGFKVVSAFDGVAAIKEIAAHNPSLILMDINMPRLDGYQLCKLVKKHETTRNIPVVMLSGKDGMFDRLRGRLVGCSGYITKPFVPDELVDAVDEYLAQAAHS